MNPRSILAGADGSPSALNAVRWAAREAASRRLPLRLVHVAPDGRQPGDRPLEEARRRAEATEPGLEVRTATRTGPAAAALIDEAGTASLVVLGSHGLGGFPGMLLGSVSSALAAHAPCPVVVVRGTLPDDPPPEQGPVVVGVDASPSSDAAIAFAFDAAGRRGAPLTAVHTWTDMSLGETWSVLPIDVDYDEVAEDERRLLAERLAGWSEKYPDVRLIQRTVRDRPVRGLLAAAAGAQLLVVGSRGRHEHHGMGLGSTSQSLLHHAACPVAVVR
ncbi:universal stress protein [Amycolatopsis thermophila]|uniref:Nucleotide-binding universal stress UspA family protein n=1 Tax=Amycolatopsis thermophila TaxID=206084 RepID=A0ABU0F0S2_9PSEU|nr:universal stress protein [Amycolatopsis thermophila]MDQ0381167.1 nucleotide-binding universal stress UspA family protein [Amycolatopsis thermophila]